MPTLFCVYVKKQRMRQCVCVYLFLSFDSWSHHSYLLHFALLALTFLRIHIHLRNQTIRTKCVRTVHNHSSNNKNESPIHDGHAIFMYTIFAYGCYATYVAACECECVLVNVWHIACSVKIQYTQIKSKSLGFVRVQQRASEREKKRFREKKTKKKKKKQKSDGRIENTCTTERSSVTQAKLIAPSSTPTRTNHQHT